MEETARKRALAVLHDASEHGVPEVAKRRSKISTLREFLDDDLEPWAISHTRNGAPALLALNTGLRRGELTALDRSYIDFSKKSLLVRAAAAKSGKSRHVPLNEEAGGVLTRLQQQTSKTGRVFNVRDVKTAWLALMKAVESTEFQFHDLRHSFASKLVMVGVDLKSALRSS